MKLIIDIPDKEYEHIMKEGFLEKKHGEMCYKAIKTAIPFEECGDCVDRKDVLRLVENKPYDWSNLTQRMDMLCEVRRMPPVTPKQRVGRWVSVNPMVDTLMCSECGENIILAEFKSNYCPWCGAKMDGGE